LLVTGLIYLLGASIWLDRGLAVTGGWLALAAAVAGWTGPVTVLIVEAVAAGGGLLAMALRETLRRRA
jgi:hypothetical protein